jgi:hypothetical protein
MSRTCENCKYEDYGLFDEPCRSCLILTNSNWEYKEDYWDAEYEEID